MKCLSSLFATLPNSEVFLVDDASTDGTEDAVKKYFPTVNIIGGNGELYWNRGMYEAWSYALKHDNYDYYLWLNDDVELYPYFFDELLACINSKEGCVVSGLIEDSNTKSVIYGGFDYSKKILQATGECQEITFMNGNVVLVPNIVVEQIGILDPIFHHDLGDVDYGLRAIRSGIKVYTTRRPIAMGYSNDFCRVRKWGVNLKSRFRKLYSPLGSPPYINFYFRRKHFGVLNASLYWIFIHIINFFPDKWVSIIWGNKYRDK